MPIKNAARTVIIDEQGKIALIEVRGGEYYKIPGGGVEEGETEIEAAKREAREEAGCEIVIIRKLGEQQFSDINAKYGNTMHHSVCFLAKKEKGISLPNFTDWEKQNKMRLVWVTFEEALKLFSEVKTTDHFGEKINERDREFVLMAKNLQSDNI